MWVPIVFMHSLISIVVAADSFFCIHIFGFAEKKFVKWLEVLVLFKLLIFNSKKMYKNNFYYRLFSLIFKLNKSKSQCAQFETIWTL